jgi:hypothetical protein
MSAITQGVDAGAAARRSLRGQIARLERELAHTLATTYPPIAPRSGPITHHGPRLLDLGQLEVTRDALAARLSDVRARAAEQAQQQVAARAKLAELYAHPERHPGARVTAAELGLPGCAVYRVRRRVLTSWWRVKVSSGCP